MTGSSTAGLQLKWKIAQARKGGLHRQCLSRRCEQGVSLVDTSAKTPMVAGYRISEGGEGAISLAMFSGGLLVCWTYRMVMLSCRQKLMTASAKLGRDIGMLQPTTFQQRFVGLLHVQAGCIVNVGVESKDASRCASSTVDT